MTRSFSDWLKAAAAAGDPAEADRCLDEAIALATDGWYWAKIMSTVSELVPVRPARVRELADRALEVAIGCEPDVWCYRKIARARALLDDQAGALEALELAVLAFQDVPRASSWGLLAKGFVELGDLDGARRCLDHGCEQARRERGVDDLARLAEEHADLGDTATAIARVEEAEAMLTASDGHGAWALAHAWEKLGRVDAAQRVLDLATGLARSSREALTVVKAWVHHGGGEGQARAFARAEELAGHSADWLEIAATAHELGQADRVRATLRRANAAAGEDRDARARIAAAYAQWLGDHAAADELGPRGLRPDELLDAPAPALAGWAPSPSGLFDWLRANISSASLANVAAADYGAGYDRNLAALTDMCATGLVPRQLDWYPGEALALTRWSEGEGVDHLARGLALTILCLCDRAELESNGAPLVESALALGGDVPALAAGLVAWCDGRTRAARVRARLPDEHVRWALISLAVLTAALDPDDARLAGLVALVAAHERRGELPRELARSQRARMWHGLLDRHVRPHAARVPALAELLALVAAA